MWIARLALPLVFALTPLSAGGDLPQFAYSGPGFPLVEPRMPDCGAAMERSHRLASEFLGRLDEMDALLESPSSVHLEHWVELRRLAAGVKREARDITDADLQLDAASLGDLTDEAVRYLQKLDAVSRPELGPYANLLADAESLAQDVLLATGETLCRPAISD